MAKVLRSELLFSREGTYHQVPEATMLFQRVFAHIAAQKVTRTKKKNYSGVQKLIYITINKSDTPPQTLPRKHQQLKGDLLKNTFWEVLLVFQLFKQFDLKIRCFILKFQKLFSQRIFKTGNTFLRLQECSSIMWSL